MTRDASIKSVIGTVALVALMGSATEATAESTLFLESQPGESLGAGRTLTLTSSDGTFTAHTFRGGVQVHFDGSGEFWDLDFQPTEGGVLSAGAFDDTRQAFFETPVHPGLSVSGDGVGCGEPNGRFVVYELVADPSGNVQQFAADFEIHCSIGSPGMFGSIRFNSSMSIEPRIAVAGRLLLEGDVGYHNADFTVFLTHPAPGPVSVNYATADGSAHAGADYVATAGTVAFAPGEIERTVYAAVPTNVSPQPDRTFSLSLATAAGAPIGASTASATILDDDSGASVLYTESQPGDGIGRGARQSLTVLDGTFQATLSGGHASIRFRQLSPPTIDLAAPQGEELVPANYENAGVWASPAPPSDAPSLSIYVGYDACNTATGRFVVQEVLADASGNLLKFAADFEEHCEGMPPAIFGSIRIHSTVPIVHRLPVAGDLDANRQTDILWRNHTTGENVAWFMNGPVLSSGAVLMRLSDPAWTVAGTADFNGDGETDILWRNEITGDNVVWFMSGTTIVGGAVLPTVADTAWKIVATGLIDRIDPWPDIVWRNQTTGDNIVWFMHGTTITDGQVLAQVPDIHWKIVGAGDADADGNTDLFWWNDATGRCVVWIMNGGGLINAVLPLPGVPDTTWTIAAVGDFNEDGRPDLLWRNQITGDNALWLLENTRRTGFITLPSVADTTWGIGGPK